MIPALTITIETFIGYGQNVDEAVRSARIFANDFLHTHQWRCDDGRSGYHVITDLFTDADVYICVISVIGPKEETP
jgi:hypothetical protein